MIRRLIACALCLALVAVVAPANAGASTYSNPGTITVNDNAPATPYPSLISVSGLPGAVVTARATLRGIAHTLPSEIDALLVGPGGQETILMSDACGATGLTGAGETFTFDDAAPSPLTVSNASCVGKSGTYKPTDGPPADVFPAPAPLGPYSVALSALNSGSPNGTWQLWIYDDGSGDAGVVSGGWSLELLPSASCSGKQATVAASVGTAGNDVLTGTPAADVMLGLGGNDTIKGLGGKDVICGGDGKDKLRGGSGKDRLLGEGGKDDLKGNGGKDTCKGGGGRDTAAGCEKERSL